MAANVLAVPERRQAFPQGKPRSGAAGTEMLEEVRRTGAANFADPFFQNAHFHANPA
jgi:hypothetical protein